MRLEPETPSVSRQALNHLAAALPLQRTVKYKLILHHIFFFICLNDYFDLALVSPKANRVFFVQNNKLFTGVSLLTKVGENTTLCSNWLRDPSGIYIHSANIWGHIVPKKLFLHVPLLQ